MGLIRVFTIASILTCIAVTFGVIPVSLPHPACHNKVSDVALKEQPSPLQGVYKTNTALQSAKKFLDGQIQASESIAISPSGETIFLADKFGWIHSGPLQITDSGVRISINPKASEIQIPGRPLGIHAVSDKELYVCDSVTGLLKVNLDLKSHSIVSGIPHSKKKNRRVTFANDLDISEDGIVYFTDSSDITPSKGPGGFYSTFRAYLLNTLEGRATGRLLAYNPETNKTIELMRGLWYANGVALSDDGSFVAVVETNGLRVHRYWLKGPKSGKHDILIANLPGFPDGMSRSPDGNFWIALVAPISPFWEYMSPKLFRVLYAWITEYIPIPPPKWGYVLKVSPEGKVLQVLSDKEGGFISFVSSVLEHRNFLFMGNLVEDYISTFDLNLLKEPSPTDSDGQEKEEL